MARAGNRGQSWGGMVLGISDCAGYIRRRLCLWNRYTHPAFCQIIAFFAALGFSRSPLRIQCSASLDRSTAGRRRRRRRSEQTEGRGERERGEDCRSAPRPITHNRAALLSPSREPSDGNNPLFPLPLHRSSLRWRDVVITELWPAAAAAMMLKGPSAQGSEGQVSAHSRAELSSAPPSSLTYCRVSAATGST